MISSQLIVEGSSSQKDRKNSKKNVVSLLFSSVLTGDMTSYTWVPPDENEPNPEKKPVLPRGAQLLTSVLGLEFGTCLVLVRRRWHTLKTLVDPETSCAQNYWHTVREMTKGGKWFKFCDFDWGS